MVKVKNVKVLDMENMGCNNGNYPTYIVTFTNGNQASGLTCRCGNGCSNTDRLPSEGMTFDSEQGLREWQELK